jgi:hypothetical protein
MTDEPDKAGKSKKGAAKWQELSFQNSGADCLRN